MRFEIYCAGASRDDGLISQMGGCGVVLVAVDNHGRVQSREFSFGLGGSPKLLADIQSVRLALASIIPPMRSNKCLLYLDNPDVASFLTTSTIMLGFREQIGELKRWFSYYKDISVNLLVGPNQYLNKAKELAQNGLTKQTNTDSRTFALSEVCND